MRVRKSISLIVLIDIIVVVLSLGTIISIAGSNTVCFSQAQPVNLSHPSVSSRHNETMSRIHSNPGNYDPTVIHASFVINEKQKHNEGPTMCEQHNKTK